MFGLELVTSGNVRWCLCICLLLCKTQACCNWTDLIKVGNRHCGRTDSMKIK